MFSVTKTWRGSSLPAIIIGLLVLVVCSSNGASSSNDLLVQTPVTGSTAGTSPTNGTGTSPTTSTSTTSGTTTTSSTSAGSTGTGTSPTTGTTTTSSTTTGSSGSLGTLAITPAAAIQPLQPDTTNVALGGQSATFSCSVTGLPGAGYTLAGIYFWHNENQQTFLSSYSAASSKSTNVLLFNTGVFVVACDVTVENSNGTNPKVYTLYATLAVYGGAISFQPITTPQGLSIIPRTYSQDGGIVNNSSPMFLCYYKYNIVAQSNSTQPFVPTLPAANSSMQDMEAEQGVTASLNGTQPPGVTITWSIPEFTDSCALENLQQGLVTGPLVNIDIFATGLPLSGSTQIVSCTFAGSWTDPNGVSHKVPASTDDTAAMAAAFPKGIQYTSTSPLVFFPNTVNSHQPGSLVNFSTVQNLPIDLPNGVVPVGNGRAGTNYWLQLLDTANDPFPGVWVQEFYPDGVPSYFSINKPGVFWTTGFKGDPINDDVSAQLGIDGEFNGADWLTFWNWPASSVGNWMDPPILIHVYNAGTIDSVTQSGVKVGTYQISFTAPSPQVYEGVGGASQTLIPPQGN